MILAQRYHDISCGHRVVGHESKCRHLHGHNYRVHFALSAIDLDGLGRVIDFGVIKTVLCEWLEREWDHCLLLWAEDPWAKTLHAMDPTGVVLLPFNPTAERMAEHLLTVVAPRLLLGREVQCVEVRIEETAKCHATARV
jgi:6-pyruvoyltetrahydropterin/6-carboxytetrahydropterin synthase